MSNEQSRSHSILKAAAIALAAACSFQFVISAAQAEELSLKGKRIGVSIVGTDHYWDLMAFRGIQDEIKALGGEAIALDAGRKDQQQIAQLQTLIAQKPDAIVEVLGNLEVLNPWLAKIREAEIPLFTVDTATPHAINNTTSNNYNIGAEIALQMVADMGGKGNVLVFNGFYSVPVCKIRYDQMKYVLTSFPDVKIVEPELRDVIPNTVQAAYSNVTDMLTKSPEKGSLNAVWACWDVPQIGATQAAEAAGRPELKTYGIDGSPEVIKMVMDENSPAAAVAAQQPYEIGKTSVQNVAKFLAGQKVPPFTFVPAVLINKENAAVTGKPFLEAAEKAGVK
ncbi:sugar ABC transporter substrate-binding protein [Mesorhizobium tianshanense]|uniref:Monosaccharide ABC transporter substrate-binding protein, CUT2 family (TC 3.A.1.2.-) n=1 Tax=Mesorhizobium tianshanense TaxID=39844 RepID=A0A562PCT9_9HYPH|nr:sugar ABC transporter substrate-binding protein [Mesorhizobium tianshanense]TWI42241.1 monosaccharide ABC transporter substrate-binding protein, CUT2 family (TC 3.A.1.2.-) [Mesorhizobium tianshanense]GLS41090.1 sugar ABC transporter substrate-binding protein [Mesorhizobium tianshanense]